MSQLAMVRRICKVYRSANDYQRAIGRGWYRHAGELAAASDPDLRKAAGVYAAMSPRAHWSVNVKWAQMILHAAANGLECPAVHTTTMRAQAWAIANGADPLGVLNGPKVRSFYLNILGDAMAVTCDVWAVFAATGIKDERAARMVARPKGYKVLADAYRVAAARLGVSPMVLQATCWTVVRGIMPTDQQFHQFAAVAA